MKEQYTSNSQQRVLAVLGVLVQAGLQGVRAGEIAEAVNISRDKVTRDVTNLVQAGWVEADTETTGVWRVTAKISRMAFAVMQDLETMQSRMDEMRKRYIGH